SGDLLKPVPGRVMAKVIFFLVMKKIFNEPYELDLKGLSFCFLIQGRGIYQVGCSKTNNIQSII
ncbi:MAG: hypothetical protein PHS31_06915, partial [Victivallaceae bacterium]|nr:hypothetical protein [Victivallaceae bacterium]